MYTNRFVQPIPTGTPARCRRFNGKLDFNRSYVEYEEGFGDLEGEHWLGLEKMHAMTKDGDVIMECRIDLYGCLGEHGVSEYEVVQVGEGKKD